MPARAAEEKGFGLIELLFAMVMLNIGILALVAAFQSGALALRRSAATSNGTAVADKTMEVYRDLRNCAIYLQDSSIPQSGTYYTAYQSFTSAYAGVDNTGAASTAYYAPPTRPAQWITDYTGRTYGSPIQANPPCTLPTLPAGAPNPTLATQAVTGPDGQSYEVFSYIVQVKPSGTGWTGGYVKQVTIEVLDPQNSSRALAVESSLFDPNVAP